MTRPAEPAPPRLFAVRERELWILLGVVLLFFARSLLPGQTLFLRDLYLWFFPQRQRLVELVAAGGLPLWDPFTHGGQPFLANVNNVALYPTALLSLVLPSVAAFNLEIVLHFLLGAAAAYQLARTLGIRRPASLLAGVVFVFAGVTLSLGNFLNRTLALPWLPLFLLFWHLYVQQQRRRWFAAAAAAGAMQLLAGAPEQLLIALLLAAAWGAAHPDPAPGNRAGRFAAWLLLLPAVAGLAAIQVAPTLSLALDSARVRERSFASFSTWSLAPARLPELVVPGFLGRTDTLDPEDFWGRRVEDEGFPLFLSIYTGASVLAMAGWAAISRSPGPLPAAFRRFLALFAAGALLLSLGRFLPLLPLIYRAGAPLLGLLRYPVKLLEAATLPVALLVAHGAEVSLGSDPKAGSSFRTLSITLAAALVAVWLAFAGSEVFSRSFEHFFFGGEPGNRIHEGVTAGLRHSALFAALLALLAWLRQKGVSGRALPVAAGLICVDLATAGWSVNPVAPAALLTDVPSAVFVARREIGPGRLFRDANPPGVVLTASSNDIAWQYRWNRETLFSHTGTAFDLSVIFDDDFDDLEALRLANLTRVLRRLPWERRLPILSAGAVTLIITPQRLTQPSLDPLGTIPNPSNVTFFVYRNAGAAPRAVFVSRWESVRSEASAVRAMLRPGFDPRQQAVIEGPPAPRTAPCAPTEVRLQERSRTEERFRVEAPCDGYVVFAEPWAAGWRARVDGRPAPIRHANSAFSAVFLPAGVHALERAYRPTPLALGIGLSLLSIAGLATLARLDRRRTNRGRPAGNPAIGSPSRSAANLPE
jgi:hypothetical protein